MIWICERCDKNHAWQTTKLIGDFYAMLCTSCLNAWHAFAKQTPEWAESDRLCVIENQLYARAQAGDTTVVHVEIPDLCAAKNKNRDAFHAVAESWFAERPKATS